MLNAALIAVMVLVIFESDWNPVAPVPLSALRPRPDELKFTPEIVSELVELETTDLDFFLLALRYTLLEHATLDVEIPRCVEKGVGLVIGGVFNSGISASGAVPGATYNYAPATPDVMQRVARIEAVCRRHDVPLPAAALQFPLGHPAVAAVIPGAISPAQVAANIANVRRVIPAALWAELKHEQLIRGDAPTPG